MVVVDDVDAHTERAIYDDRPGRAAIYYVMQHDCMQLAVSSPRIARNIPCRLIMARSLALANGNAVR